MYTRDYTPEGKQENFGFASWDIATPADKHFCGFVLLKNAWDHYVLDGRIAYEDWPRLMTGEFVQDVACPTRQYAIAWKPGEVFPALH
jgi:hypothetical protein